MLNSLNKKLSCVDMVGMKTNRVLAILTVFILNAAAGFCLTGPTLLMDSQPHSTEYVYGIGPIMKYKRVAAPQNFGGDMTVWGVRAFAGKLYDPEIGFVYYSGTLNGESQKFNLDMAGLTLEDSFREDARVKWRVSFGVGHYRLRSRASGYEFNKGSFSFLEPMIVGVLPMSRHIVLEFGAGYTFAGATGVRVEGLALNAELLMGKF
jgi:hypothetical protein